MENNLESILQNLSSDDYEDEDTQEDSSVFIPIGMNTLHEPMYSPYGHIFEKSKIESWLSKHKSCPITREPLTLSMLKPVIFISEEENMDRHCESDQSDEMANKETESEEENREDDEDSISDSEEEEPSEELVSCLNIFKDIILISPPSN